jgi:dienelactone hydrolase
MRRQLSVPAIALALACLPEPPAAAEPNLFVTSLREGGKPVKLEIPLLKPPGRGPHPLAVINHGSAGQIFDLAAASETWAPEAMADYFLRRGFAVAFPQRRGRGHSDGTYDEGLEPDRTRYSCDAKRASAGVSRAVEDVRAAVEALSRDRELQTSRLLIVGQGRGGLIAGAYAARHPAGVIGVINFAGGWIGGCPHAFEINRSLLALGAKYQKPVLWLYGAGDQEYSSIYVRHLHSAFTAAGGKAELEVLTGGHDLYAVRDTWLEVVDRYLHQLGVGGPTLPAAPTAERQGEAALDGTWAGLWGGTAETSIKIVRGRVVEYVFAGERVPISSSRRAGAALIFSGPRYEITLNDMGGDVLAAEYKGAAGRGAAYLTRR